MRDLAAYYPDTVLDIDRLAMAAMLQHTMGAKMTVEVHQAASVQTARKLASGIILAPTPKRAEPRTGLSGAVAGGPDLPADPMPAGLTPPPPPPPPGTVVSLLLQPPQKSALGPGSPSRPMSPRPPSASPQDSPGHSTTLLDSFGASSPHAAAAVAATELPASTQQLLHQPTPPSSAPTNRPAPPQVDASASAFAGGPDSPSTGPGPGPSRTGSGSGMAFAPHPPVFAPGGPASPDHAGMNGSGSFTASGPAGATNARAGRYAASAAMAAEWRAARTAVAVAAKPPPPPPTPAAVADIKVVDAQTPFLAETMQALMAANANGQLYVSMRRFICYLPSLQGASGTLHRALPLPVPYPKHGRCCHAKLSDVATQTLLPKSVPPNYPVLA